MREWIRSKQWEIFKKQEHESAINAFRSHIITSEPDRNTVVEGWVLYKKVLDTSSHHFDRTTSELHVSAVINALHGQGRDTTPTSLAHFFFRGQTVEGKIDGTDVVGELLVGLTGSDLEKAKIFCNAMDQVGYRAGDLQEKYPEI